MLRNPLRGRIRLPVLCHDIPPKRAAVFIDAENVSKHCIHETIRIARRDRGSLVLTAKAYTSPSPGHGRGRSLMADLGIVRVEVPKLSGKNSVDLRLCIDAVHMINSMRLDKIYLATGDSDFRHLLAYAREMDVSTCIVQCAPRPTRSLIEAADEYFHTRGSPHHTQGPPSWKH